MTAAVTGPPSFDRLARPYRWLEYLTFGPLLQRCRTYYLVQVSGCRSGLILGDGDGRFTASLLSANPEVRIHAVDGSPAMLQALRRACRSHAGRVTTEAADLRSWSPVPGTRYDLIASHFFLDCLSTAEIASLAARLQPALHENALWIVSDFAIPPGAFGRRFAAPMVALLYRVFGILTGLQVRSLPDHAVALHSAGWSRIALRSHLRGLLISEIWSASPFGQG